MSKCAFIVFACLLPATLLYAQEPFRVQSRGLSLAREQLAFFGYRKTAASVAFTNYIGKSTALRISAAALPYQNSDHTNVSPDEDDRYPKSEKEYWKVGLVSVQVLKSTAVNSRTMLLAGLGPLLGMARTRHIYKMFRDSFGSAGGTVETVSNGKYFAAGLSATLGCEIFLKANVSLFADYEVSVAAVWQDIESISQSESVVDGEYSVSSPSRSTENRKYLELSRTSARFGLSFYF